MRVTNLFVKRQHGAALESVATMGHDQNGIRDSAACAPFRQALIAAQSVTADCGLDPGDLRENIVVDFDQLYDLPSGTVVRIGEAMIRLTFHCEPCKKILKLVEFDRIVHRRGVFGCFLNSGTISLGDEFIVTDLRYEPIPYAVNERIRWFLKHQDVPAAVTDLIHKIGLPSTCTKLLSRFLQKRSLEAHRGEQASAGRLHN
jgi:MOSC domain-containing protein YiiM